MTVNVVHNAMLSIESERFGLVEEDYVQRLMLFLASPGYGVM